MKHELATHNQHQVDESFAHIIENEYGTSVSQKVLGETAVRQVLPFGDQFMSMLPHVSSNPRATTPGGLTSTTDKGVASLDDSSSNDVA
jgi:hypothetical protein